MEIEGRKIGPGYPPYIIAEMSNNHMGSVDRAKKIMLAARRAGADAVKIATYDADALTIDCTKTDFMIRTPLWKGRTYYQLYKEIALPLEYTKQLFDYAREIGITLFSSPFDERAVDLLMASGCPAFKIASFEAVDPQFLNCIAQTGKPILMSTGISSLEDLDMAMRVFADNRAEDILLFHCVSAYPAAIEDYNLSAMQRLKQFSSLVGLSDHSLSDTVALAAIAMGGCAIEKHFTLSRGDGGPDAAFSIEEDQMKRLKINCQKVWKSLGSCEILNSKNRPGREHARSLYVICDVDCGEPVSGKNIRSIRPGYGLSPVFYEQVMGRTFTQKLDAGTALKWEHIS
ncbi:MAG: pseudaminic acid synthase [Proteobacteria bacterium]|nr:pseudaminic acid synthase [Pseudomonadota bacterium]